MQPAEISVTIKTELVQPVPTNILYNQKQQEKSLSSTSSQRHPNAILMEKLCLVELARHGKLCSIFRTLLYTVRRTRSSLIISDVLHRHENVNSNQLCFPFISKHTVFALFPFQTRADSRNTVYSVSANVNNRMYFRNCI